jgi:hypothetical protein
MRDADLSVAPGECVALTGPSGAGKSTLMRMIYGNYLAASGAIRVGGVDVARAEPREVLELRRTTLGYVSQFLRVIPRVPTLEVVAEPLLAVGNARGRGARPRPRAPRAPPHPRDALVAQPHDLLGRRAAAGEHRARLRPPLPRAPPRRADREPRRREPRDGAEPHRGGQGARRGHRRHLPRRGRARARRGPRDRRGPLRGRARHERAADRGRGSFGRRQGHGDRRARGARRRGSGRGGSSRGPPRRAARTSTA